MVAEGSQEARKGREGREMAREDQESFSPVFASEHLVSPYPPRSERVVCCSEEPGRAWQLGVVCSSPPVPQDLRGHNGGASRLHVGHL